jgi:phage terminase large subunit GpA-like protein
MEHGVRRGIRGFVGLRLDTDYFKTSLALNMEGGGVFDFPDNTGEDFKKSMESEIKTMEQGKQVWKPRWEGINNHWLDTAVIAYGIADRFGLLRLRHVETEQQEDVGGGRTVNQQQDDTGRGGFVMSRPGQSFLANQRG